MTLAFMATEWSKLGYCERKHQGRQIVVVTQFNFVKSILVVYFVNTSF